MTVAGSGQHPGAVAESVGVDRVERAVAALIECHANYGDERPHVVELADALGAVMAAADLAGRWRTLEDADRAAGQDVRADAPAPITFADCPRALWTPEPEVALAKAPRVMSVARGSAGEVVERFAAREPRLASSGREVSRLYQRSPNVFALALSASKVLAARVRDTIVKALSGRTHEAAAIETIAQLGDFSRAYAETVYRTNAATAYDEGRGRMALNPAVRAVVPAMRFTALRDSRARPNHTAADGLVAAADDPVWRTLKPPLGHNCRCRRDLVTLDEAHDLGVIDAAGTVRRATVPPGAGPDPGFRG